MKGLKQTLHDEIKRRGYLSSYDVEKICHELHYKLSNAERRLRESESPEIERVMKDGVIVGYRMKQGDQKLFNMPEREREVSVIF